MKPFSTKLEADIEYLIDCCDDHKRGRWEAIWIIMEDCYDRDNFAWEHKNEIREYAIELGIYKEYSKEQIDVMMVIPKGSKKYSFKKYGKYYCFDSWKPIEDLFKKEAKELNCDCCKEELTGIN